MRFGTASGLDQLQRLVRFTGNLSPFSILNTFGFADWLSPYTLSPYIEGGVARTRSSVVDAARQVYQYRFDPAFLGGAGTRDYLRAVTGRDVRPTGLDLVFERNLESSGRGRLYQRLAGAAEGTPWELLSDSVKLQEVMEARPGLTRVPAVSRVAFSFFQSLGLADRYGTGAYEAANLLFTQRGPSGEIVGRERFIPVPSLSGEIRSIDEALRRGTTVGAPFAFGMERLNRLIQVTAEQLPFLSGISETFQRQLIHAMGVQPGMAHRMFVRYGLKAAGIGAIVLGIKQLDWARRNWGLPGNILASGATSLGVMALVNRFSRGVRPGLVAGLLSFGGQLVLPGFREGVWPGIRTSGTYLSIGRAGVGAVTGMSAYRRLLEGLFPGVTDWKTGALVGLGTAIAGYSRFGYRTGRRLDFRLPQFLESRIGVMGERAQFRAPISARDIFWESIGQAVEAGGFPEISSTELNQMRHSRLPGRFLKRQQLMATLQGRAVQAGTWGTRMDQMAAMWQHALQGHREWSENNALTQSLVARLDEIGSRWGGRTDIWATIGRQMEQVGTRIWHGLLGAPFEGREYQGVMRAHGFRKILGRTGLLFAAGFAAHGILTGGFLGSMEGPGELSDIYAGRQMVPVKRGRYWEGGGTPFEGTDTLYYRPHSYVLSMTRAKERAIWGEDEDAISPIRKFFIENFTYGLERRTYTDRPYPITGTAFENIPVIGGLLGSTLGRFIKPPRLMHVGDWARYSKGNIEFAYPPEPDKPAYKLGGLVPGKPKSPYTSAIQLARMDYQFKELSGMWGWLANLVTETITGSQVYAAQRPILATSASLTSPVEAWWDMNLGGFLGQTEVLRRFLPRPRSEEQKYNPIENTMPEWLPTKFHYGDPYKLIHEGDVRLPGPGYTAIHPELRDIQPEQYPLVYQYSILTDVAPYSNETQRTRQQLYQARMAGQTTERENAFMDQVDKDLNKKMVGQGMGMADPRAIEIPGISPKTQGAWAAATGLFREAVAPVEYMIPMGFRPVQKLFSNRQPIEQYEYERLYGTPMSFWNKPIRDWFRPAFYSAAHFIGMRGKPAWRQEADEIGEYFDRLEFVKWMIVAKQAELAHNPYLAQQAKDRAGSTVQGVNPKGDPLSVYMALPAGEKKFFDAFAAAQGRDRDRILDMVPADQVELYKTIWQRIDAEDQTLYAGSPTAAGDQYLAARYADAQSYFQGRSFPRPDWIGWNQAVDVNDVKLKYIETLGQDIHDFGMWESQERDLARKPYLEGTTDFLYEGPGVTRNNLFSFMFRSGHLWPNGQPAELSVNTEESFANTNAQLYYNDDREPELMRLVRDALE
jgi:hypothetical protein